MKVNNLISEDTLSHDNASDTFFADTVALWKHEINAKNYSDYAEKQLYQGFCEDGMTKAEQSAERLNCCFQKSTNDIDSLLIYLLDYYSYGYHYEGFSEYIGQRMHELFYRNDTIGKCFDLYMTKVGLPQNYQDTIRIRMMFDIVCHLLLLSEENADNPQPADEIYQLPPNDYMDYPYFNSHNNIFNNLSSYQDYY